MTGSQSAILFDPLLNNTFYDVTRTFWVFAVIVVFTCGYFIGVSIFKR